MTNKYISSSPASEIYIKASYSLSKYLKPSELMSELISWLNFVSLFGITLLLCQILIQIFKLNDIMKFISFLVVFVCILLIDAYPEKEPQVEIKNGYVRGKREVLPSGREYTSFRGIPYAKPPVGDLRFKAPLPAVPWEFPHDATKEGPVCMQKNYLFSEKPEVEGQEDCLYLNVYVPTVPSKQNKLLPVMVFIHWGGFFAGRGTSDYLGPEYLMEKDVILVTFNYRLAVLGLLTTLDDIAPGNYGFKDQVLALKFVQENIEQFGGDKNRVTLFGQSAGSGSTSLHLISPLSRGLFQQAISQSGVSLNPWLKPLNVIAKNVTESQAQLVGCGEHVGNSKHLIDCLRKVDAKTLVDSSSKFKYFYTEPLTSYGLTIETKTGANPNPFITKSPEEYLKSGDFEKVPYIIGITEDEGMLRASPYLRNPQVLESFNKDFATIFPQIMALAFSAYPQDVGSLQKNITDFYLGGKEYVDVKDPKSVQGFIDLYTDRGFAYGIYQVIQLQSQHNHSPIWLYNFAYRGQYSYGDLFATTKKNINFDWGASHCDDLLYLFKSPKLFPKLKLSNHDLAMKERMVRLFTNFVMYGSPDADNKLHWVPQRVQGDELLQNENFVFLNVTGRETEGHKVRVQKGFLNDRLKFWKSQRILENL